MIFLFGPAWRDALPIWGASLLVGLLGLGATFYFFVDAPPAQRFTLATGSEQGQYFAFGQRYATWLKTQFGMEVTVRPTAGTGENLQLLLDDNSGVQAAFVQGGVPIPATTADATPLLTLGSVYREPLWVFYRRGDAPSRYLSDFIDKRISVGPRNSGTFPIAAALLEANGFAIGDQPNSDGTANDRQNRTTYHFLPSATAAEALLSGRVDVAFMVVGASAGFLQPLFRDPNIDVMSFDQWASYARRFPFLSPVVITKGLLDLGRNIPDRDIYLLAPTATLVVREDLHSSLASLLVQAAHEMHRKGDILSAADEFPTHSFTDLPLHPAAQLFYDQGPPVLQRWVGFHWAVWIDRVKIMLVPILMLLFPLIRATPPLWRWRTRSRIYRWYSVIREADIAVRRGESVTVLRQHLHRIRKVMAEVADVEVPLSYMEEFYNMRFHLSLVQERLQQEIELTSTMTTAPA